MTYFVYSMTNTWLILFLYENFFTCVALKGKVPLRMNEWSSTETNSLEGNRLTHSIRNEVELPWKLSKKQRIKNKEAFNFSVQTQEKSMFAFYNIFIYKWSGNVIVILL